MKLTNIEFGPAGSSEPFYDRGPIILSFKDPKALYPYNVIGIDGLDGGAFKPKYYLSSGGKKFYTLEQEPRDITFKLALNPNFSENQTYSKLRDDVYIAISKSRSGRVEVHFRDGSDVIAVLSGFVVKVQSSPSDKDQMMEVTIACDDPVLRSPNPTLINYDVFDLNDFVIQDNLSTAPHGISLRIKINSNIPNLIITDPTDASWYFKVVPLAGFNAGDVLYLSSEVGRKSIHMGSRNLMARVTDPSIWPIIFPGDNHFAFNYPDDLSFQHLSYYRAYWGV